MKGKTKAFFAVCMIVVLFAFSNPIYGQEKGGMGYFIGGVGWILESSSSSIVYSVGGGGQSITNKWIVGGEGHSSFGPHNAGGYGFFNLGHLLVDTDLILLYPLIGLGGGAMTREGEPSVSKCALVSPAVCFDFLIPIKDGSGFLIGLHAGYTFTVYSNTFSWSMPHVRFVTGGYGFGR
jgi:hypothetical protein